MGVGVSGGEDSPVMTQKTMQGLFLNLVECAPPPFGGVTFKCASKRKQTEPGKQAKKEKALQAPSPRSQDDRDIMKGGL